MLCRESTADHMALHLWDFDTMRTHGKTRDNLTNQLYANQMCKISTIHMKYIQIIQIKYKSPHNQLEALHLTRTAAQPFQVSPKVAGNLTGRPRNSVKVGIRTWRNAMKGAKNLRCLRRSFKVRSAASWARFTSFHSH